MPVLWKTSGIRAGAQLTLLAKVLTSSARMAHNGNDLDVLKLSALEIPWVRRATPTFLGDFSEALRKLVAE